MWKQASVTVVLAAANYLPVVGVTNPVTSLEIAVQMFVHFSVRLATCLCGIHNN